MLKLSRTFKICKTRMSITYDLWVAIHCTFYMILVRMAAGEENLIGPSYVIGFVGQNITFMWNTTKQEEIKSAIFGLSKGGMADPQFINVNMLTGRVHHNPEMSEWYSGRVHFVGSLKEGHAWFLISDLKMNDTNEYLVRVAVDVDTVMSHTVVLKVQSAEKKQGPTLIGTASTLPIKHQDITTTAEVDSIIGPSYVIGFVGQNITFMWNTTKQEKIKSAIFGLSKEGMADPQFINVNMLTGRAHHNSEMSEWYSGRVHFVGSLKEGRAWFLISDLKMNDSNEYLARIAVDVDKVMSRTVVLKVKSAGKKKAPNNHTILMVTSIVGLVFMLTVCFLLWFTILTKPRKKRCTQEEEEPCQPRDIEEKICILGDAKKPLEVRNNNQKNKIVLQRQPALDHPLALSEF